MKCLTQFPGGWFAAQKRAFVEARRLLKRAFHVRVLFYPSGNCDFCGGIPAAARLRRRESSCGSEWYAYENSHAG